MYIVGLELPLRRWFCFPILLQNRKAPRMGCFSFYGQGILFPTSSLQIWKEGHVAAIATWPVRIYSLRDLGAAKQRMISPMMITKIASQPSSTPITSLMKKPLREIAVNILLAHL